MYKKKLKTNHLFILKFSFIILLLTNLVQAEILLFAPASLREALIEVANKFENVEKLKVKQIYLGTSELAKQIKSGAKADIFISANKEWMDYLEKNDLIIKDFRKNLLSNQLVVISNANNEKENFQSISDLSQALQESSNKISLALVNAVPAGIYAKEALKNMNIWDVIQNKIAQSSNVRAAMQYVVRQELDYGIVYLSDALATKKVKVIYEIDQKYHRQILYPVSVLNRKASTIKFYKYLNSDNSKNAFKKRGFVILND